jgi:hypothetical protein
LNVTDSEQKDRSIFLSHNEKYPPGTCVIRGQSENLFAVIASGFAVIKTKKEDLA